MKKRKEIEPCICGSLDHSTHPTVDPHKPASMRARIAYVVVVEQRESEGAGHFLGLAKEGERGYYRLSPGFGPYKTWDQAAKVADEANRKMGLNETQAWKIIASSMRRKGGIQ
jgi:hypothetical protein